MGVCKVFVDVTIDASTHKMESDIRGRTVGVAGIIKRHTCAECLGVCIEEPFSQLVLASLAEDHKEGVAAFLECRKPKSKRR